MNCPTCGHETSLLVSNDYEEYVRVCENSECPDHLREFNEDGAEYTSSQEAPLTPEEKTR